MQWEGTLYTQGKNVDLNFEVDIIERGSHEFRIWAIKTNMKDKKNLGIGIVQVLQLLIQIWTFLPVYLCYYLSF